MSQESALVLWIELAWVFLRKERVMISFSHWRVVLIAYSNIEALERLVKTAYKYALNKGHINSLDQMC